MSRQAQHYLLIQTPPSQVPFLTAAEQDVFERFRLTSVHNLPYGFFNASLWNGELLAASMQYPVLRYTIIAFAASQAGTMDSVRAGHGTFMYTCYGRAISSLRRYLEASRSLDPGIVLVSCLLLMLVECHSRDLESAKRHYDCARQIMSEFEKVQAEGRPLSFRTSMSQGAQALVAMGVINLGQQFWILFERTQDRFAQQPECRRIAAVPDLPGSTDLRALGLASEAFRSNLTTIFQTSGEALHGLVSSAHERNYPHCTWYGFPSTLNVLSRSSC